MSASLALTYDFSRDDDDFGWLPASLKTPMLSGSFGFWVQWQDVTEWGEALFHYPIPRDRPVVADWGMFESDGTNYQPIVKVAVVAVDAAGHLDVEVHLSDHADRRRQCETVFRTTYAELARFGAELRAMMGRTSKEAVLTGYDFG